MMEANLLRIAANSISYELNVQTEKSLAMAQ